MVVSPALFPQTPMAWYDHIGTYRLFRQSRRRAACLRDWRKWNKIGELKDELVPTQGTPMLVGDLGCWSPTGLFGPI